jgi:hypothetical protein
VESTVRPLSMWLPSPSLAPRPSFVTWLRLKPRHSNSALALWGVSVGEQGAMLANFPDAYYSK